MGTKLAMLVGGAVFGVVLGFGLASEFRPRVSCAPGGAETPPAVASENMLPSLPFFSDSNPTPQTLAEILQIPGDFAQTAALYELAMNLDEARIVELLDEAVSLRPVSEGQAASSILYGMYAELNPEGAVDRLLLGGRSYESALLGRVFHTWARADLDAALARAMELGMQQKLMAGMSILRSRDDVSADERRAIAQQLGLAGMLPQLEAQQQLSRVDDPAAAWSTALGLRNRQERGQRLMMLAEVWARRDPQSAMAAVEGLERADLRAGLKHQVIQHWASHDAEGAVEWVLAQPASRDRSMMVSSALTALATSDPQRAVQLTNVLSGAERRQSLAGVLGAWSRADPRAAVQALASVQDPATRLLAVRQIAGSYAESYPDEAAQWLAGLDPAEADQAAVMVVRILARENPLAAGDLVAGITDPAQKSNAARRLVSRWARDDPEAAVGWTSRIDDPELRVQLLTSALPQWAIYDTNAAVSYVDRLEDVPEREAAIAAVLHGVQDPSLMDRLYESLTLPDQQRRAAVRLFQYWLPIDPGRASTYQVAAGITDEQAAEMLEQPTNASAIRINSR